MPQPRLQHLIGLMALLLILATGCATLKGSDSGRHDGLIALPTPKPAIDFTLQDSQGAAVSLAEYRGKVVWLSFWATWCHACQQEMRFLKDMQERFGGQGLQVMAINVDSADEQTRAATVARGLRLNYPVLFDPDTQVASRYNPSMELPVSVLIDREGRIRYILKGYEAGENEAIEATIRAIVSE